MERQLVVFKLAGEYFGVDIFAVERIIDMQPIAIVPHVPAFIKGVADLYGEVLPVMDLRKRFDLPSSDLTRESRLVVVEVGEVKVGMLVDAVSEVVRVGDEDIESPPGLVLTPVNETYIAGIAKVGREDVSRKKGKTVREFGRLIILLNLAEVLSTKEKLILQDFERTLEETSAENLEGVKL